MKIKLTPFEKQLIRRLMRLHIENLEYLLYEEDLIQNARDRAVTMEELRAGLKQDLKMYRYIRENPNHLLELDEAYLSLIRHSLTNAHKLIEWDLTKTKWKNAIAGLWRKFITQERYLVFYNPN